MKEKGLPKRKEKTITIKTLLVILITIILTTIITYTLFNILSKEKDSNDLNETEKILDTGKTFSQARERYIEILEILEKRELLIIEQDKLRKKEIQSDYKIQELKQEGIKTDVLALIYELKDRDLLKDDDVYLYLKETDENILKIGKIDNNTFSYEVKIKSIAEILGEEAKRKQNDVMIPLSEYLKQKEKEQGKEEETEDKEQEQEQEGQEQEEIENNNNNNDPGHGIED